MAKRHKNWNEDFAQQRNRAFEDHMWNLGGFTVREYFRWCEANGFRASEYKSCFDMQKELAHHRKQRAVEHLRESRAARNPIGVIGAVCEGRILPGDIVSVQLREVCSRIADASLSKYERRSLYEFLSAVWRLSKLPTQYEIHRGQPFYYMDALIAVHRRRRSWRRPLDQWRPVSHNREKQFLSLVRHLLIRYRVPRFFGSVWFRTDEWATRYQKWYIDVGNGANPRHGPVPVSLTKRVAHYFLQAPDRYSVEQALRFGQVMACGGDPRLCDAVIETRLGSHFENDDFWQSVIRFFVRNRDLDLSQVGPIVDFLQHHKFERQQVLLEGGETRWLPPPQPNLSMHKRTLRALLAQVDDWHRRLGKVKADAGVRWAPSGIQSANFVRGKGDRQVIWRITELLSHKELVREGNALKHCVATYSRHCRDGHASIWSLTSEDAAGNVRRRQTIEVSRNRTIVQCRGRMNKFPGDQEKHIVALWAKSESLGLGRL